MGDALAALRPPGAGQTPGRQAPGRPKGLNVLGMFARYPALAQAYLTFNGHVLYRTSLSPRQRELLILRVAHARAAEYEWEQHVVQARDAGLTDDEIARARDGAEAPGWAPLESALLRAADELVVDAEVSDRTWAILAAGLDMEQLMDVVFTVGAYDTLAMALKSFNIQLDDDLRRR